jgi:hypothetical protein
MAKLKSPSLIGWAFFMTNYLIPEAIKSKERFYLLA